MSTPQVLITMAGRGERFRAAGYTDAKYRIEVRGRTLFGWSMDSLRSFAEAGSPYTFVALAGDGVKRFIADQCSLLGIPLGGVVELDDVTDGQATTAYLAGDLLDPDRSLVIYNIDTYVEPGHLRPGDLHGDGWVPCFAGVGDHWSFARTDSTGRVIELREKERISPHATLGLYGFASAGLYTRVYESGASTDGGERYIAPLYNQLLEWGRTVTMTDVPIDAVHPLGTPAEVHAFGAERHD